MESRVEGVSVEDNEIIIDIPSQFPTLHRGARRIVFARSTVGTNFEDGLRISVPDNEDAREEFIQFLEWLGIEGHPTSGGLNYTARRLATGWETVIIETGGRRRYRQENFPTDAFIAGSGSSRNAIPADTFIRNFWRLIPQEHFNKRFLEGEIPSLLGDIDDVLEAL